MSATTLHAAKEEAHETALPLLRLVGVIRPADRFNTSSCADFAMRGFAISFLTLSRVASSDFFFAFFFIEHPGWFEGAAIHFNLEGQPQFAAHTAMPASGAGSARPGQNESSH